MESYDDFCGKIGRELTSECEIEGRIFNEVRRDFRTAAV